jgi:hypothetical protein
LRGRGERDRFQREKETERERERTKRQRERKRCAPWAVLFVQKGDESFPQLSKRSNSDPSSRFFIGEAREKMGNLWMWI